MEDAPFAIAEQAERRRECEQATVELDSVVGVLLDNVSALSTRLTPVLRPTVQDVAGPDSVPRAELPSTPLARNVTELAHRIGDMNGQLRGLLDRLEV